MKKKLLVVGDSPVGVFTGFGCVVRNLVEQFKPQFHAIDIWAINHLGWPQFIEAVGPDGKVVIDPETKQPIMVPYPHTLFPAGCGDWNSGPKLSQLLNLIMTGDYTHLWILGDLNNLSITTFPRMLRQCCDKKKVHVTIYFPVDADIEPEWLSILSAADARATYTEYGLEQVRRAGYKQPVEVIPHGVDTRIYHPLENRMELRKSVFGDWLKDDEILFINVNRNERRKAVHHTMQIVKILHDQGAKVKLLMHMPDKNPQEGIDLQMVARQLKIDDGIWQTTSDKFVNGNGTGMIVEAGMNDLYNCADICITTTRGEGWGLSMTEGLAAGCALAMPLHTSLVEIHRDAVANSLNAIGLPLSRNATMNPMDNSRVRYDVDVEKAAEVLFNEFKSNGRLSSRVRHAIPLTLRSKWSWEKAGLQFLKLMKV